MIAVLPHSFDCWMALITWVSQYCSTVGSELPG